ncbi:MAG: hypothetical protein JW384_01300 [Nitrosomonadaceae bacterium]|nr:hypothetical protein [Nitrosomonadaceae bacterium]
MTEDYGHEAPVSFIKMKVSATDTRRPYLDEQLAILGSGDIQLTDFNSTKLS